MAHTSLNRKFHKAIECLLLLLLFPNIYLAQNLGAQWIIYWMTKNSNILSYIKMIQDNYLAAFYFAP